MRGKMAGGTVVEVTLFVLCKKYIQHGVMWCATRGKSSIAKEYDKNCVFVSWPFDLGSMCVEEEHSKHCLEHRWSQQDLRVFMFSIMCLKIHPGIKEYHWSLS